MNELIKKNIVLVVVLALAVLISAALLVLVVMTSSEMTSSTDKVYEISEKIQNLNKAKPAPLDENLKLIQKDIEQSKRKKVEIQRVFGSAFRPALKAFADALGVDEITLLMDWHKFAKEKFRAAEKPNPKDVLKEFLESQKLDAANIEKAKEAFAKEFVKLDFEKITDRDLDDFLLEALGVQQKLSRTESKYYFINVGNKLKKMMSSPEVNIELPGGERGFVLFNEFATQMPNANEINYIIKHCRLNEDLFRRFVKARLSSVISIKRLNLLEGEESGGYMTFKYELKLAGPQQSIRDFLNSLQDAYRDDRVYKLRRLELRKSKDETKSLKPWEEEKPPEPGFERPPLTPEEEALRQEKKQQPMDIVIGKSDMVEATMEIDYVIYVGNELQRD